MRKIDPAKLRRISIKERGSKVNVKDFGKPHLDNLESFLDSLPDILKTRDLKRLAGRIVEARRKKKPVLFMMGAHVVKVGVTPYLMDLAEDDLITSFSANTAFAIHDLEIAFFGETSEDVEKMLPEGKFGIVEETARLFFEAVRENKGGLGERLGRFITEKDPKYVDFSLLSFAFKNKIPFTLHLCVGTDILHQHPNVPIEEMAKASYEDFLILSEILTDIEGGVVINVGSAVIMPEVFVKALNMARNLGYNAKDFYAANFDMFQHYRPSENILRRTGTKENYAITGHHEILIPIFTALVKIRKREMG
jgi:hypothetical protein